MSEFSRYSAFHPNNRGHHESDREFVERTDVPLRTPEENQRVAASIPKTASIPVRELEDIVEGLKQLTLVNDIEDAALHFDIEDLAERLASFLPG